MDNVLKGADLKDEVKRLAEDPNHLDENIDKAREFFSDVRQLVQSMANLYHEHAAELASVGVTVTISGTLMGEEMYREKVGVSIIDIIKETAATVEGGEG